MVMRSILLGRNGATAREKAPMITGVHPSEQTTQRAILRHVSWETYERLLVEHEQSSSPRFTYDGGELEIISPSTRHERLNHKKSFFPYKILTKSSRNPQVSGFGVC
jgi:hypothetical protein